ncbi:hypothetical protein ETAA8_27170 [Anatilimnocola aggregata]|uniref:Uncharacterized protein n=1 Tax=Anatilimnocola aggregata TaxID=2528021 RepID=A0A517YBT0_9BACT|nr:hypothetical protein [Anatilimnocola aggregata]QDU27629.1 hypothetical protein ETAA8_27170 [Anatilimnocola aggregata]
MTGFEYQEVVKLAGRIRCLNLSKRVDGAELVKIADAADENLKRIGCFALLPAHAIARGQRLQAYPDLAAVELHGAIKAEDGQTDGILRRSSELFETHRGMAVANCEALLFNDLIANLSAEADRSPFWSEGLASTYSALLLGAYTVFESMSADLWVAAVNSRPKTLAVNVIRKPAQVRDEGDSNRSAATIPLTELVAHGFNLTQTMGDLLKQRKRVNFLSYTTT